MLPAILAAAPMIARGASMAAGALGVGQLIKDVMAKGPDPEKLAAITQARDARADQILAGDPSMNRQKAIDAANLELKPFLDQAGQGESTGMDIAQDVINVAGMGALAAGAGKLGKGAAALIGGKKTNANAPVPGGPKTASEGVNGALEQAKPRQAETAKRAMRGDEPELIHNAAEEALEGPDQELIGMALAAKKRALGQGYPG